MVRLTALSNEQNQPVIRLGKRGSPANSSTWKRLLLYGRNRLPQELVRLLTYPANSQPRNGCAIRVRSPTPRVVRSNTSPKKRHKHSNNSVAYPKSCTIDYFAQEMAQALQQLGRLPQEWYDRLLRPRSGTSTPTARSPTPRVVRSTTSPRKGHKHSNNSVAYPKSGTIDYIAQRGTQTLQQLDCLPQERYNRLL